MEFKQLNELLLDQNFISNVCVSYDHSYGLLNSEKQNNVRSTVEYVFRAILNNYEIAEKILKELNILETERPAINATKSNSELNRLRSQVEIFTKVAEGDSMVISKELYDTLKTDEWVTGAAIDAKNREIMDLESKLAKQAEQIAKLEKNNEQALDTINKFAHKFLD